MMEMLGDACLAVVGDGPMRGELEENLAGTSTVFTGYLEGEELARAYAAADIFVFPSASDTFGNVVLEAMASGLPVIAPRAGGPVDHVVDGENGFLFDPGDLEEMVSLVRWLASNLAYTRRLGASARAYAEAQSWEEIMDELLDEYAALASLGVHSNGKPDVVTVSGLKPRTTAPRKSQVLA
jgi:glycosyltransferase involved in cell wall biosynthesis